MTPTKTLSVLSVIIICCAPLGMADTIRIPVGEQQTSQVIDVPARGDSKAKVIRDFGEPDEKFAPVGTPPITRWRYPEFDLYFESDSVITAVKRFSSSD